MNKLKYIPGDLVMTNGVPLGTTKDVVYRVTSSDPSKTLKLSFKQQNPLWQCLVV